MEILKKTLKYISIFIISLLAIFILFLVGLKLFLPKEKIPTLVSQWAKENLDASVEIKEIDLTFFKHFPYTGIELNEGAITSHQATKRTDSLISFNKFTLLFNPIEILKGEIDIKRILLKKPRIYAYKGEDNTANWDIFKQTDTLKSQPKDTTESNFNFNININHIAITDKGVLIYRSTPDSLFAMLSMNSVVLRGNFSNNLKNNRLRYGNFSRVTAMAVHKTSSARFSIDTLNITSSNKGAFDIIAHTRTNVRVAKIPMAQNVPIDITGRLKFGESTSTSNILGIENFKIATAKIPINLNGDILFSADSIYTTNLTANIEEFPFRDFLKYIPKKVFPDIEKVKTSAKLSVESKFNGSYNLKTGSLPNIDIKVNIPNSNIKIDGSKLGIKDMAAQLNFYCRPNTPDSNRLEIKKLLLDGDGIMLKCSGYAKNITDDPYLNIKLSSFVSLDTLRNFLPNSTGITANGVIDANINIEGKRSQLNLYNLKNTNITGELNANNVLVQMPSEKINCTLLGTKCVISSQKSGIEITLDSANINIADSIIIQGRQIKLNGENITSKDNKSKGKVVHPFNGVAQAEHLRIDSKTDSLKFRVKDLKGTFSLLAHNNDYSAPHLKGGYSSKHIFIKQDVNILSIANSYINIDAFHNTQPAKKRRISFNNINSEDDFAGEDYNFRLTDKSLLKILNKWSVTGSLNAQRIRTASPYFPLRNSINNADIEFNLHRIKINSANFVLGQSKFNADGSLSGIKNALSRGGKLRITLNVNADTLNFNEIAGAMSAAQDYTAKSEKYKESIRDASTEDQMLEIMSNKEDSLQQLPLVIVPKNIEANFNMKIRHGIYASLILNGASGSINSMDRKLHIKDFKAHTSAGAISINAFYATPSKKDLSAGFDIALTDINIGSFIKLVPNIDTILPMLKSFDGIINSSIAATTQIDTNMNIIFSSLKGVARIKGDSLVLMDSETFAQIAKTLKFKNRERNLVDSICVEILMDGNNIEVFPFMANLDRYKIAISGSQDIDMNFKYHFSVIKSPIPIRFGVNIFGNMDDFDFKIGKALYKNVNLPVYTHVIDSTTVNLRNYINNVLQKGVDAALQKGAYTRRLKDMAAKDTIDINNIQALSAEEARALN